jgi:hypothetical protein
MGSELIGSVVLAWITSKAIEIVKRASWFPWLTLQTATANLWVSRLVALIAVIGLHISFDHDLGILTVTGLTLIGVRDAIFSYAQQLLLQQAAYRHLVKPVLGADYTNSGMTRLKTAADLA